MSKSIATLGKLDTEVFNEWLTNHDAKIRIEAVKKFVDTLLCLFSNKSDFYSLENGDVIYGMEQEDFDKMVYETLEKYIKEQK